MTGTSESSINNCANRIGVVLLLLVVVVVVAVVSSDALLLLCDVCGQGSFRIDH